MDLQKLCVSMLGCDLDTAKIIVDQFPTNVDPENISYFDIKNIFISIVRSNNIQL